jgi:NTE family protein
MKKFKTGLVLSGGGTRGFAHLGIIAALFEKGIVPDVISGTSVGAIVGAFIASGKSPQEVLAIFKKGWFFKYTKLHIPVDGLLKLDGLKEVLQKEINAKDIEDLEFPFYVSVSNLNTGLVEYKSAGPLGETVLASASIPILFSPVKLGTELYVDGGVVDNIPVKPIQNDCEKMIVCNISPINPKAKVKNLIQITSRTFYMNVNARTHEIAGSAAIYIEPEGIDKFDILSLSHADKLYKLGYDSAIKALEKQPLRP